MLGQKNFWISCTGLKVPFWQNWKIAKMALLNLCMKFEIFFGQKHSFEALWKWQQEKKSHNLSQGPPNPGLMQEKGQKGDFLKKDSRELFFFSCFRFLWFSQRPGTLNWERVVFLPSKNLYRKCEEQPPLFSFGNKSSLESFSEPGILFPAIRNIYSTLTRIEMDKNITHLQSGVM